MGKTSRVRSFFLDGSWNGPNVDRCRTPFQLRFNIYSITECRPDQNLTFLGGVILSAPLSFLNHGTKVQDGVILGGGNLGFTTRPFILTMDTTGNILWSSFFDDLLDGQDQILRVYENGSQLDLFTWADNFRSSFYMLNGYTDGTFPSAVQVHVSTGHQFRVEEASPTGSEREYMVICQSDSNNFDEFLTVLMLDSSGVLWAKIHDHGTLSNQFEGGYGLVHLSDSNWIYNAFYQGTDPTLQTRLVKMDNSGSILWAKEYFISGDRLSLGIVYETSDSGMLMSVSLNSTSESFIVKLDAAGQVQWAQRYEQLNTNSNPIVVFYKNDQGQLYGWSTTSLTEMDEDINVCDMVPFSSITSMDVTPTVSTLTLTSSIIVPDVQPMPYEIRSGTYSNVQSCIFNNIDDLNESLQIQPFPNPAHDQLYVDLSSNRGRVNINIYDLQGRLIHSEEMNGGAIEELDISDQKAASYLFVIETEEGVVHHKFVKE